MYKLRRRLTIGITVFGAVLIGAGLIITPSALATPVSISGSMEGNNLGTNAIRPGDWISGGYHFQGQAGATYVFQGAKVTIPVSCTDGKPPVGNIVVNLFEGPWVLLPSSTPPYNGGWYPWLAGTNPGNEPVVPYEGSVQAPDLCSGGAMYDTAVGAVFTADVVSTDTSTGVDIQFHYRDPNAKGMGNHNCYGDPKVDPKINDPSVCGASVSSTYH
ncbi:MAG: hypothetical protein JOZ04_01855, partial [Acidimicrobiia bacterium]|nr:hypothetical protein [Acidimicrobiia bacterium]